MSTERKIMQISAAGTGGDYINDSVLYALCDDASVWLYYNAEWSPLPPIPPDTHPTTPTRGSDE